MQTGTRIPARLSPSLDAITMETEALEKKENLGLFIGGNFQCFCCSALGQHWVKQARSLLSWLKACFCNAHTGCCVDQWCLLFLHLTNTPRPVSAWVSFGLDSQLSHWLSRIRSTWTDKRPEQPEEATFSRVSRLERTLEVWGKVLPS